MPKNEILKIYPTAATAEANAQEQQYQGHAQQQKFGARIGPEKMAAEQRIVGNIWKRGKIVARNYLKILARKYKSCQYNFANNANWQENKIAIFDNDKICYTLIKISLNILI